MPRASEEQVPKPLTYTLMYHFLWCILFLLSAVALSGVFLAAGQPLGVALAAPLPLVFFGVVAGLGSLATYVVRIQVLLNEATKEDAFRWSAISSWGVILLAPLAWLLWRVVFDPMARSVPADITSMVVQVELIVWWLSHLLSVRGLSRGRRKYLPGEGLNGGPGVPAIAGEGRS